MCIADNDGSWIYCKNYHVVESACPEYGDICTVIKETKTTYILQEFPIDDIPEGWDKECFVPLSDIDERERVSEEWKEKMLIC